MIVNLTPHRVDLVDVTEDGDLLLRESFLPSGSVARVSSTVTGRVWQDHRLVTVVDYGQVVGLPPPAKDTYYLVALAVALAARDRQELLVPFDQVRDENGRVVATRKLATIQTLDTRLGVY